MKRIALVIAFLFSLNAIYGQTTLAFCGGVDAQGTCIYNNSKFFFAQDSANQRIYMEVKDVNTFAGTNKITFKFYSIAKNGDEKYLSMTDQEVKDNWMFAWLPHVFDAAGKYNVKVYNDKDLMICSKTLEFFQAK